MSNENFKVPVIKSDTINELTTDTGTTVEGVLHKDGYESATVYRKTVVKYEVKFVIDGSAGHEAAGDKTACYVRGITNANGLTIFYRTTGTLAWTQGDGTTGVTVAADGLFTMPATTELLWSELGGSNGIIKENR